MRVTKNKVTLLSAAVAALLATSAQAVVNLDTGAGTPTYASEAIPIAPATTFPLANAGNVLDLTGKLGFGVSNLQDRYIRFDLVNGSFNAAVMAANLTNTTLAFNNTTVVQGGAVGQTYVVFQVTGAGAHGENDVLTMVMPAIRVANTSATVTVTYSLHETAVSAQGATPSNASRLITKTANLASFAASVAISARAVSTETIAATTNFTKFCSGAAGVPGTAGCASTGTDVQALVGAIACYGLSGACGGTTPLDPNTGATVAMLGTVAGATSNVVFTGDFSASSTAAGAGARVFSAAGNLIPACDGGAANQTVTATTLTNSANIGATASLSADTLNFCAVVNGTSSVAPQSFTGVYNRTAAAAGATNAWSTGTISLGTTGTWVRDGAELQSPWFNFAGGTGSAYNSRFFFMNTGSNAAQCTATVLGETGNTLTGGSATTTGFSIPANGMVEVPSANVVSAASGSLRAAVRFTCLAPSANIQGRYVLTHSSGSVDSGTLLRPGTN